MFSLESIVGGIKDAPSVGKSHLPSFVYESGDRPSVASHGRAQHGLFDSNGLILGLFLRWLRTCSKYQVFSNLSIYIEVFLVDFVIFL